MELPRTLPMHPIDLVSGFLVPEVQAYLLCVPFFPVRRAEVRSKLAPLVTDGFPRLCYRFRSRYGTIRSLELAQDPGEPISTSSAAELERRSLKELRAMVGDRHWHLLVVEDAASDVVLLVLLFDHFLGHGELARGFLCAAGDRLGGGDSAGPRPLHPAREDAFRRHQSRLVELHHREQPWASYQRLELGVGGLQRRARGAGLPFTEALTLELARSIQAVAGAAGRSRPLDVLCFRMDEGRSSAHDPAVGNQSLLLEQWEASPDGASRRTDAGPQEAHHGLERFARAYGLTPGKPLVNQLLRGGLAAARLGAGLKRRDKLVVNNLGRTEHAFFRPIFFDPTNNADRFGLVYVDGNRDRLTLQLSPPHRYLARFDWTAFEARLLGSLGSPDPSG
ncbi:MAG: hypothetical protein ABI333_31050 [bacterium]